MRHQPHGALRPPRLDHAPVGRREKLAIVKDSPTLQDCEAQTVLQTFLTSGQTVVGQKPCVQTSDGRWAYVQLTAIDRSARTMSFKIVVWKLPTDP